MKKKNTSLSIQFNRHGPKSSIDGPLSQDGEKTTLDHYNAYNKDSIANVLEVHHSPIHRTKETVKIFAQVAQRKGTRVKYMKVDDRLSEGRIAERKDLIDTWGGLGGKWVIERLKQDMIDDGQIITGKKALYNFVSYIKEQYNRRKNKKKDIQIEAFTHAPLMLAFLITIEKLTGEDILPKGREKRDTTIFDKELKYLSTMYIGFGDGDVGSFNLLYGEPGSDFKMRKIPVSILDDIMKR